MAKAPSANGAASAASPPTSAVVLYWWPLAWNTWPCCTGPNWLMAPSTGHSSGAPASGRAPGFSARVKKSLKLA